MGVGSTTRVRVKSSNGHELQLDFGLPLGIIESAEYGETAVKIAPGDQLTFLSDGVVEAQSESGALFGFDSTRRISTLCAEEIAAAAREFGQQDDDHRSHPDLCSGRTGGRFAKGVKPAA